MSNIYEKIKNVRKPRIHISYDVEAGNSTIKKELPFVVGVLGDFSGASKNSLKPLKHRKFINIHGENFDQVMKKISPSIKTKVDNVLKNDGSSIPVELSFQCMEDFSPGQVAKKIPALKNLLDIREKLNQLVSKVERSDALEDALSKLVQDEKGLKEIIDHLSKEDKEKTDQDSEAEPKEEDKKEE